VAHIFVFFSRGVQGASPGRGGWPASRMSIAQARAAPLWAAARVSPVSGPSSTSRPIGSCSAFSRRSRRLGAPRPRLGAGPWPSV